jgi:hypothetical protein
MSDCSRDASNESPASSYSVLYEAVAVEPFPGTLRQRPSSPGSTPYVPRSPTLEPGQIESIPIDDTLTVTVISHNPQIIHLTEIPRFAPPSPTPSPLPVPPPGVTARILRDGEVLDALRVPPLIDTPTQRISIPSTLSPRSAFSIISRPDLDLAHCREIVQSVAQAYSDQQDRLNALAHENIARNAAYEKKLHDALEARDDAQDRYTELYLRHAPTPTPECPEGFIENRGRLPHFRIPLAPGQENLQARFIRQTPGSPTTAEGTMGTNEDLVYLIDLYAQSRLAPKDIAEPLPAWFLRACSSDSALWPQVLSATRALDDWGLLADMARYRAHDAQLRRLHLSVLNLEQEIASAEHCFDAVRARLVAAQAGKHLASLSALTTPSGQDRRAAQAVRHGRADPRGGRGRPPV